MDKNSREDRSLNRGVSIFVGITCGILAVGFTALTILLTPAVLKAESPEAHTWAPIVIIILISFGLFFSLVSWRALFSSAGETALLSVRGWRPVSVSYFAIALLGAAFAGPAAAAVPGVIGLVCLFKDPRVRELF